MKYILCEIKNSHLSITLNRPDVRNAFNPEMISELTNAFSTIDRSVRAVLLSGHGKSFCAGADLNWMKSMVNYTLEENKKDSQELHQMFHALRECPVPVIAQVHGYVMGGGLGLIAASDIVLAEENTQFCFSEARLGLVPAVISPFVLKKSHESLVGELMLTAQMFNAQKAKECLLVQDIGSQSNMDQRAQEILNALSQCGPEAVRETKSLLRTMNPIEEKTWEKTTEVIAIRRASAEGQEGILSFLEKRDPKWRMEKL